MSTIDYKALAKRVAQRAIYAENNADPNNKAWAADLRAVVSLLNGMAEAQPVAPVALVRAYNAGYMAGHHDTVEGGFVDIHPSDMDTYHADVVAELGLTAAPQAEPCIGNDSACPCQDGDACHYKDAADGTKAWPVPQAEPKLGELMREQRNSRIVAGAYPDGNPNAGAIMAQTSQAEPKRDWSVIDAAIREYLDGYEQIGEDDAGADACYTPTERERDLIYDAINGLLADESFVAAISAPQAEPKREPLSDERITKGEYVLATKFSDGDPGDHWGVGFYDRLENGRHYIVDRAGQQIRGGGFRRAGRITVEVGIWLLSAAKSLEASPPGTVNLWTMLTERAHEIGGSDE